MTVCIIYCVCCDCRKVLQQSKDSLIGNKARILNGSTLNRRMNLKENNCTEEAAKIFHI